MKNSRAENNMQTPRCLECLNPLSLDFENSVVPLREVGRVECGKCAAQYATVGGVPYLGNLGAQYFESLLELSAIGANVFDNKFDEADLEKDYRLYIQILDSLAEGQAPEAVRAKFGLKEFPTWLSNRLNETLQFQTVTNGIDFGESHVLDVGAGTGFDSLRFLLKGARVTCLEFNPVQAALGHQKIKSLRWLGGSGYQIPFPEDSFDFVVANAAMHHLLDIPVAFQEMLRVLKVGGSILTFADSFRSNETSDYQEAQIFDGHHAVMGGVNERVPRISEFTQTPIRYSDSLSGFAFAYVYDRHGKLFPRQIGLNALHELNNVNGTICFRVQKTKKFRIESARPPRSAIPVRTVAEKLVRGESFMAQILPFAPERIFNIPLFARREAKIQLLNGFRLPEDGKPYRRTNGQARLFFEGDFSQKCVALDLSFPFRGHIQKGRLEVRYNDTVIREIQVESGFRYYLQLPLEEFRSSNRIAVGLRLKGMADSEMWVYTAELSSSPTELAQLVSPEESGCSLSALKALNAHIAVLLPQQVPFEDARSFLGHAANLDLDLDVFIHEDEFAFYQNISQQIRLRASRDLLQTADVILRKGSLPVYFDWPQKSFSPRADGDQAPRDFWTVSPVGVVVKRSTVVEEVLPAPPKIAMRSKVRSALKIFRNRYLD